MRFKANVKRIMTPFRNQRKVLIFCFVATIVLVAIVNFRLYPPFNDESNNIPQSKPTSSVGSFSNEQPGTTEANTVPPSDQDFSQIRHNNHFFNEMVINETRAQRKVLAKHGMALPSTEGVAKRILIISTYRSGSSFTGELLSQVPGALYHFEPLTYLGFQVVSAHNDTLAKVHVDELNRVLNCDYLSFHEQMVLEDFRLRRIKLYGSILYKICSKISADLCRQDEFLSFACRHSPVQVTKVVHMPLRQALKLLRQPELNLHVVLLVRDPRASMASRHKAEFCTRNCEKQEVLCGFLRDNYESALEAQKEFPDTFTVLRYEDLAVDPSNVAAWLLRRVGLPLTPSVRTYLYTHTKVDGGEREFTKRQLGSRVSLWKSTLPWEEIESIQNSCADVLANYGYVPIPSRASLNDVSNTVKPFWKLP